MPSEYWRTRLRAARAVEPDERRAARRRARPATPIICAATARAPRVRGGRGAGRTRRAGRRRGGRGWRGRGRRRRARPSCRRRASRARRASATSWSCRRRWGRGSPVTVPGSQRKETSLTTVRPPKRFVSPVDFDHASASTRRRPATAAGRSARQVDSGIDFGRGSRAPGVHWRSMTIPRGAGGPRSARCFPARCRGRRARGAPRATGWSTWRCSCSRSAIGVARRPARRGPALRPAWLLDVAFGAASAASRCGGGGGWPVAVGRRSCSAQRGLGFVAGAALIALFNVALRASRARAVRRSPRSPDAAPIYPLIYPSRADRFVLEVLLGAADHARA